MRTQMVGRATEQAQLRSALADLASGRGRSVLVVGEPGIGKTTLLDDLADHATAHGIRVLAGRAVDGSGSYRPFAEAVTAAVRASGLPASPTLRPYRAALGRLVPDWATEAPVEAAVDPVVVLGEGLLRLLEVIAPAGCVLLLEDLHSADAESLALAGFLIGAVATAPVLMVGSSRRRLPELRTTVLDLRRLAPDEVESMIDSSERVMSKEHRASILQRSEGLPLLEAALLAAEPEGATSASVPPDYRAVVDAQLGRVSDAARRLINAAAALGPEPDWDLLPEVTGIEPTQTAQLLGDAVRVGLLTTDRDRLAWRHAMTREAVWAGLLVPERGAHTRRAAEVLLTRGGPDAEPAAADLLIDAGAVADGCDLLLRMTRREFARGSLRSAHVLVDRLTQLGAGSTELADVRVELLTLQGRFEAALEVGGVALDDLTGAAHAELCFRLARCAISLSRWTDADGSLSRAGRPDDPRSAILLADSAHGAGRIEEASERAEHALLLAERVGTPAIVCEALVVLARIRRLTDVQGATELYRRAAALAAEHGLRLWRVEALMGLGLVELLAEEHSQTFEQARDMATDLGLVLRATDMELVLVDGVLITEGPNAAAQRAGLLAERGRVLRQPMLGVTADLLGAIASAVAGDRAAVRAMMRSQRPDELPPDLALHAYTVPAQLAIGDHDLPAAVGWLDRGVQPLLGHGSVAPLHQFGLWALLRTVVGGPADGAREQLRDLPMTLRRAIRGGLHYADAVAAGRLGDQESAGDAYARGDAALEPIPWWHRVLRLVTLECALDDRWGEPVPQLRADLAVFEATGYLRLARIARDLLRRAGAETRRGRVGAAVPAQLRARGVTSRELDVLILVEAGRSNAQIAEQLFLSVRTVETHVANLLAKSGVTTRADLRDWHARLTP